MPSDDLAGDALERQAGDGDGLARRRLGVAAIAPGQRRRRQEQPGAAQAERQRWGALIKDLDSIPSKFTPGKTLLDETLIVAMSEFGRTTGAISETRLGREHYMQAHSGMLTGGGIRRGQVLGKTDDAGGKITDFGWSAKRRTDVSATR